MVSTRLCGGVGSDTIETDVLVYYMNNISTQSNPLYHANILPAVSHRSSPEWAQKIQQWCRLEKESKEMMDRIRKIRQEKTALTDEICEWIKTRTREKDVPKPILLSNGEMRMYYKKEYSPLSYAYVETCLSKIIQEKEQVEFIMKYLKENRKTTLTPELKHVIVSR